MFRNYLKTALRIIRTQKVFSLINIAGLSLGMACTVLILLWVQDELSYDQFHENGESIYRVEEDQNYSGEIYHVLVTPHPAAPAFKSELPEVVEATRYTFNLGFLVRYKEKAFFENEFRAVDPSFFEIFTFPFIEGDERTALDQPFSVVITREMSEKYFGNESPVGQVISANNSIDLMVTGVIENIPRNSSFQFDFILPYGFLEEMGWSNNFWGSNSIQTFVQLQEGSGIQSVSEKMTAILKSHYEETATTFVLAPFTRMHLHTYVGYSRAIGNIQYVYIFSIVAAFVLLLACINFMNLSTARSANRSKEVGMRKVVGASRMSLAGQFLSESIIMAFSAMILAVLIVLLLLPVFNQLSGKEISLSIWSQPVILLGLIVITLVTGVLAGSYPAFYLSSFRPIGVFKGNLKSGAKSSGLRRILVVLQFALSILLIIGTTIVYSQLNLMMNKNLGYDKEHLLYIRMRGDISESYESLKNELLNYPNVLGVSASEHRPGLVGSNSSGADWDGKDPEKKILISHTRIDYDFIETMKIEMSEGRSFTKGHAMDAGTDSTGTFLINERLADIMGVKPIIGAKFSFLGRQGSIIGVMKDFHHNSVRVAIEPLALAMAPVERLNHIVVRIQPENISSSIDLIERAWAGLIPDYPFEFRFVDEDLDRLYRAEQRMGDLLKYFAVFAVIISCLGLFGLASFMAEQKTKEIGIRKVLGATSTNIILLLSNEFTRWVLIANLIAWPVAYFAMNGWLQKFAYRVDISIPIFLGAGILTLLVALLTVGFQAIKSSQTNPAEALKYE